MYNFSFYYGQQSGVYQQQLNRVQLYKSTSSIMQDSLTPSAPTEMRQQSSTDINLSIGTRDLSVVQPVCARALAHYSPRMHAVSVYNNLRIPSELLGFVLQDQLRFSTINISFSFVSDCPI
jgi:hypothetical protein